MTKNEIVRRLREAGINASTTDRSASAYIQDAIGIRATAGWFGFRITCDTQATERRVRTVLERYYNVEISGGVWRLQSKRRLSVMASGGLFPPVPPTPAKSPMYLEAAQANSTVSMVSTLTTAPNLEYSLDGETWQEWQHTTAEGTHTFDTITLGAIGDKVYFRGDNPDGLAFFPEGAQQQNFSNFIMTGAVNGGGNVMSLLDKTMALTVVPQFGFMGLFAIMGEGIEPALLTPPSMDIITTIGDYGCSGMYSGCTSLTSAADMPALTTIGEGGCSEMYGGCENLVLVSGDSLTFDFAPLPVTTTGGTTYSTPQDVSDWMKPGGEIQK